MKHRIGLTVTDPNHPMVSKRKETIQKTVRVTGDDREKAIDSAIAHYKRKGYKVHDHHYIGTVQEGYGSNRGYAHGFASPHAPSLGGRRHREDDEGWDREPKQADVPHAVHINGKKWKSYGSQSHAQNVANKIKGATVHKEEVDLEEGTFKYHMDKAIAADQKGDAKKKAYHLDNARSAKLAMPSKDYAKNRELLDKHRQMSEAKDAREYDYEGDMAKSQLRSIIANAQRAHDMLEDDTNMAEWVQSKITLAADYISTVADYMQSEVNEEAKIVHTRTGANGTKYHIRQDSANDFSLHRETDGKLKHIDTYGSLQRAKSVLDNEVKEEVEQMNEGGINDLPNRGMGGSDTKGSFGVYRNSGPGDTKLKIVSKHKTIDSASKQVDKLRKKSGKDDHYYGHLSAHQPEQGKIPKDFHEEAQSAAVRFQRALEAAKKKREEDAARNAENAKRALTPVKEAIDKEHPIAKEYQAMKQHDIKTLRNMIKGQHKIVDTSEYRTKDHAISAYLRHKHGDKKVAAAMGLKEEEMDTRIWEAWSMGKRDPQRGIKVGQQVRSYDFPGMHDDHYIEGHVVGETPHAYQIRTNRVVRAGKEVPVPAHMSHVEAPKGKGMFSGAYAVHKIIAKQDSVAAQVQPAQGAAKTFAAVRGKK